MIDFPHFCCVFLSIEKWQTIKGFLDFACSPAHTNINNNLLFLNIEIEKLQLEIKTKSSFLASYSLL